MTQRKIDVLFRLVLYSIPLLFVVFVFWNYCKNNNVTDISLTTFRPILVGFNDLLQWTRSSNSIFKPFYDWVMGNIICDSNSFMFTFVLEFTFYCVYVEFAILFKNVMCYLFRVAEYWLHRGLSNGK